MPKHEKPLINEQIRRLTIRSSLIASISALCVLLLFCLQEYIRGAQPFGTLSVQLGDQFSQYVPFAAEFRRILLGTSPVSSYFWTWGAGGGVPMHGNIATYNGGILFPLVLALTPEHAIETGLFLIVALSYALAGATMSLCLQYVQPALDKRWVVLLSMSYALCTWAVQDASFVPMWLSAYYILPLLAIVAVRAARSEGFFIGVLVIAFTWWSNYYTAVMASLGAALFLVFWLALNSTSLSHSLRAIAFFGAQGVLGVSSTAIVWLPTLRQVMNGIDWPGEPIVAPPLHTLLGHILPWIVGINISPSFAAGSLVLLLTLLTLSMSTFSLRFRLVTISTVVLLFLSFSFPQTLFIWNVFDEPNGNLWRAAFVITFMMTVISSFGAQNIRALGLRDITFTTVAFTTLVLLSKMEDANYVLWTQALISLVIIAILVYSLSFESAFLWKQVIFVLLFVSVATESVLSNAFMLNFRDTQIFRPYTPWTLTAAQELGVRDLLLSTTPADDSRIHRVRFDSEGKANGNYVNRGMLYSLPSLGYYSSLTPAAMLKFADHIGVTKGPGPRAQAISTDPVAQALMSVDIDFHSPTSTAQLTSMPLLHVVQNDPVLETPVFQGVSGKSRKPINVFGARNEVLGKEVYTPVESIDFRMIPSPFESPRESEALHVSITCPEGTLPAFDAREYSTRLLHRNETREVEFDTVLLHSHDATSHHFSSFTAELNLQSLSSGDGAESKFACFSPEKYASVLSNLPATTLHTFKDGTLEAEFYSPVSGTLVFKMPIIEGYSCTVDGVSASLYDLHGLIAIPISEARSVSCNYSPPWHAHSAVLSVVSLVLAGITAFLLHRKSRVLSAL